MPTIPTTPNVLTVTDTTLRPPTGYVAHVSAGSFLLLLTRTVVSNNDGHTITYTVPNALAPVVYTLDSTAPALDHGTLYIGTFSIKYPDYPRNGVTIDINAKAFALTGSGYTDSIIDAVSVQIPRSPEISFDVANTIDPLQKTISISADFVGNFDIYYTTDGTDPTIFSTKYTAPFLLTGVLSTTKNVRAIAIPNAAIGLMDGAILSAIFQVTVTF